MILDWQHGLTVWKSIEDHSPLFWVLSHEAPHNTGRLNELLAGPVSIAKRVVVTIIPCAGDHLNRSIEKCTFLQNWNMNQPTWRLLACDLQITGTFSTVLELSWLTSTPAVQRGNTMQRQELTPSISVSQGSLTPQPNAEAQARRRFGWKIFEI